MEFGTVKFYNEQKGFGFIERPGNQDDVFFHHTNVVGGLIPSKDMAVKFTVVDGRRGKQADRVDVQTVAS